MLQTNEDQIVKVHMDAGAIWFSDGTQSPVCIGPPSQFLRYLSSRDPLHVRMLGTRENAGLILSVYRAYCSPQVGGRLEVASPLICEDQEESQCPEIVIYRMRQCLLPASMGGWHVFDQTDYPSYAITAEIDRTGPYSRQTRSLLRMHPVWPDLQFLTTWSVPHVATVISLIRDPRWFIDLEHPARLSRLLSYLGLDPKTMRRVTRGELDRKGRTSRCFSVLRAWQGMHLTNSEDFEAPGSFLWRRWRHHGEGWRGNLRASRAFVVYLIRTWQQRVFSPRSGHDFFLPDSLLKGREAAAYASQLRAKI